MNKSTELKGLKTFAGYNAEGTQIFKTRCFTQEQAAGKLKVRFPDNYPFVELREVKPLILIRTGELDDWSRPIYKSPETPKMIRESIKSELKKREWSVSRLAEESGIRYPSLTKFLNQSGSLSIDNLDIVFQTLDLSIQKRWQNKNGDNADQPAKGDEPA